MTSKANKITGTFNGPPPQQIVLYVSTSLRKALLSKLHQLLLNDRLQLDLVQAARTDAAAYYFVADRFGSWSLDGYITTETSRDEASTHTFIAFTKKYHAGIEIRLFGMADGGRFYGDWYMRLHDDSDEGDWEMNCTSALSCAEQDLTTQGLLDEVSKMGLTDAQRQELAVQNSLGYTAHAVNVSGLPPPSAPPPGIQQTTNDRCINQGRLRKEAWRGGGRI